MFKKSYAGVNEPFFGFLRGQTGSVGPEGKPGRDGVDGKDGISIKGDKGDPGNYENQFDFVLGKFDQVSRGNTGASRAMIKNINSQLVINYMNDFKGGIVMDAAKYCFIDTSNNADATCFSNSEMKGLKYGHYNNRYDLNLGGFDTTERGNSGPSRALAKLPGPTPGQSMLYINYRNDFQDGIQFDGSQFCFYNPVADASGNRIRQCLTASDFQKLKSLII